MMDQAYFRRLASEMAHIHARHLLDPTAQRMPQCSTTHAVDLIKDYVHHLGQPALAVEVALRFHPVVETWAVWAIWSTALNTLLDARPPYKQVEDEIRLLNHRSQAARALNDFAVAHNCATAALHLAEAHHQPALAAESLNKLSQIASERGDFVAMQSYLEQAYSRGKDHLSALELGHLSMNLGVLAVRQGRFLDAHRLYADARKHYCHAENQVHLAKLECNMADLCLREGRMTEIPAAFLHAVEVLRQQGARYDHAMALNDLGYFYLHLKQWNAAREAFEASTITLTQLGALTAKLRVLTNIVELYVTTKQWAKARASITEARELADVCDRPLASASIDVDQGRMLEAQGDHVGARQYWEAALVIQEAVGAIYAAQQTRRLLESQPSTRNE